VADFVKGIMSDAEFTSDLESFLGRTQLVALGRIASLSQVTLLLTCPGVPDLYQGSEVWDLSLVDPDNRRPVDYDSRHALLEQVAQLRADEVMGRMDDGSPKLWLIARLLEARAERPELFGATGYVPLNLTGSKARCALGYVRQSLLVLVPRLPAALAGDWADTEVVLPEGRWTNLLTGDIEDGGRSVRAGALLARFPVAVMAAGAV
jgi:(1->4)-alpha-D-glucan 1-alpha-D-glucosylmutase